MAHAHAEGILCKSPVQSLPLNDLTLKSEKWAAHYVVENN